MIETGRYLRARFRLGGREMPFLDCWGLYRTIVGEATGVWLGEYQGVTSDVAIARMLKREEVSGGWHPLGQDGAERPLDLVLMKGLVGAGRETATTRMHVGCVTRPGWMIDIEETNGVLVREFRRHPTVRNRVIGVFRPEALMARVAA